ncbi:lysosomal alpha-mannosidase [Stylonychia lemnae]|uniref:Lysosomal alpha-mannosidase n=1 Tax=Stylonychia lemnae TaxID=5949 RepID=A0A078A875_STYLE|nr:lysosomal alpha-mannosidase [Stylonychia lemnae]|eukprot:CDW78460.1 lysosomal alpha-mannosidase [Stylonychia lemnae]
MSISIATGKNNTENVSLHPVKEKEDIFNLNSKKQNLEILGRNLAYRPGIKSDLIRSNLEKVQEPKQGISSQIQNKDVVDKSATDNSKSNMKILSNEQEIDDDKIYIHIVTHSHNDVGWVQTPSSYYSSSVKTIITSVIEALLKNKSRKFSQAEIYYFQRWWEEQTDDIKQQVQLLVKEGRLEFVNGGISSQDEACTSFEEAIINMMVGHQFLQNTFNYTVKSAWHLDQFGHSSETVDLMIQMGFEAIFMARINDDEKTQRKMSQELEFIWQPTYIDTKGELKYSQNRIFTHVTHEQYYAPCNLELDEKSTSFDRELQMTYHSKKISQVRKNPNFYITCIKEYASHFKTNQILFPFGNDFSHFHADLNYQFLEDYIRLIDQNQVEKKIIFKYSTTTEYLEAISQQKSLRGFDWPEYHDDFFPLNMNFPGHYWSGFYTSRPNFKSYVREFTGLTQQVSSMFSFDIMKTQNITSNDDLLSGYQRDDISLGQIKEDLINMFEKVGELAHHDTITGTSPNQIIQNQAFEVRKLLEKNEELIVKKMKQKCFEQGLMIEKAKQYLKGIDDRRANPVQSQGQVYYIVYNPNIFTLNSIKFLLANQYQTVEEWDDIIGNFKPINILDNFCSKSVDEVNECDINLKTNIQPYQVKIYMVTFPQVLREQQIIPFGFSNIQDSKPYSYKTFVITYVLTFLDDSYVGTELYSNLTLEEYQQEFGTDNLFRQLEISTQQTTIPTRPPIRKPKIPKPTDPITYPPRKRVDYKQYRPNLRDIRYSDKDFEDDYLDESFRKQPMYSSIYSSQKEIVQYEIELNYSLYCNQTLNIHTNIQSLFVVSCTVNSVTFKLLRNGSSDQYFVFDFRYYQSYSESVYQKSGLYVFKTSDNDSRPYEHKINTIQVFQGKYSSMITINYRNSNNKKDSQVKLVMRDDETQIEFDVFFSQFDIDRFGKGKDVTINWQSLNITNNGTFYTDSNALRLVKRIKNKPQPYPNINHLNDWQQVAANFYPINSGIMIDDAKTKNLMFVMNDRPQGGSGYHEGRVELMLIRKGSTNDALGLAEVMDDQMRPYVGIDVRAIFYLDFSRDKKQAIKDIMKRHVLNMNKPIYFSSERVDIISRNRSSQKEESTIVKNLDVYLNEIGILDIQLIPSGDFNNIYLRTLQFTSQSNTQNILISELMNKLCEIQNVTDCFHYKIEEVYLHGQQKKANKLFGLENQISLEKPRRNINLVEFDGQSDYFIINNYKVQKIDMIEENNGNSSISSQISKVSQVTKKLAQQSSKDGDRSIPQPTSKPN